MLYHTLLSHSLQFLSYPGAIPHPQSILLPDDPVKQSLLPGVDCLINTARVPIKGGSAQHKLIQCDVTGKITDHFFDFGVIKYGCMGLVSMERPLPVRAVFDERIRRNMDQAGFFSQGPAEGSIDLIPTVIVVTGQMEAISQGLPVADEPGKRHGKLLCGSDGPQAGAVLRFNDRFVPNGGQMGVRKGVRLVFWY